MSERRVSDSGAGDCSILASVEICGVFHFLIVFLIFLSLLDNGIEFRNFTKM